MAKKKKDQSRLGGKDKTKGSKNEIKESRHLRADTKNRRGTSHTKHAKGDKKADSLNATMRFGAAFAGSFTHRTITNQLVRDRAAEKRAKDDPKDGREVRRKK